MNHFYFNVLSSGWGGVTVKARVRCKLESTMKSEAYTDWLNTLKEGDEYETYCASYWSAELRKVKITKRTAKCIFIGDTRYLLSKNRLPLPATNEQLA